MVTIARALAVVELPDAPARELTGTDDMYIPTTQIRIKPAGAWHRRGPIATETACGKPYGACASREYELAGELCPRCFSSRERYLAKHPDAITKPSEWSLMRTILTFFITLVVLFTFAACTSCSANAPLQRAGDNFTDCAKANALELLGFGVQAARPAVERDFEKVTELVFDAGALIGGCWLAEWTREDLAPSGERSAPGVDDGHRARDLLERVRRELNGGKAWRTAHGDL